MPQILRYTHTHTNIHLEAHYKGMLTYTHTVLCDTESLAGPSESDGSGTQI